MILEYIDTLRHAPITKRRKIAAMWTLGIVSVIAIVWAGSLLVRLHFFTRTLNPATPTPTPATSGIAPPY